MNGNHKASCFDFLKVGKWFKSNKIIIDEDEDFKDENTLLKCDECGVGKDMCQICIVKKQKHNVHIYMIPKKIVKLAKQIKEELEIEEQKNEAEKRLILIEESITSNKDMLKSIYELLKSEQNKPI